jgi:dyslexia susceptibility 1 candidate gene 1 protein
VREKKEVKMDFSERKFAHLPARESQHREAPYPKSKKLEKEKTDVFVDIEETDPLWLKDKGDHFYKRNDFHSALSAYSKSIKNDKDFLMVRLNRATTFLKIRSYKCCLDECNDILSLIEAIPEKDKIEDEAFYMKISGRTILRRGVAHSWLS